jgi:hypothetical protein
MNRELYREMLTKNWDWFCSFSFRDAVSVSDAKEYFQRWIEDVQRLLGATVYYYMCVEKLGLLFPVRVYALLRVTPNSRHLIEPAVDLWCQRYGRGYIVLYEPFQEFLFDTEHIVDCEVNYEAET